MNGKHILTRVLSLAAILVSLASGVLAADPGIPIPFLSAANQVTDQGRGFMLIYNIYTSSASNPTHWAMRGRHASSSSR